jgi:hypothetical protein
MIALLLSNYSFYDIFKVKSVYATGLFGGVIPLPKSVNKTNTLPQNKSITTTISSIQIISDRAGIPLIGYGYVDGVHIGFQRNPVTIAHYAVDYYNNYKQTGNKIFKKLSLANSNWLVEHTVNHGNYSILEYNFPWPHYNLSSPWRSGLAQAEGIIALIKANEMTGNKTYLETANMFLNSFFVTVKHGGVTYKTPQNGWWYETFAGNSSSQPRVLDGMMAAVIGIHSYSKYTNSSAAKYLFDQGISALIHNLARYNVTGYNYSYYDILGGHSSLDEHKLHIDLLTQLYNITNDAIFKQYHDTWANYKAPPYIHGKMSEIPTSRIYS